MQKDSKIYIAGHRGMVGSAVLRLLVEQGYSNIVTKTKAELDLTRQDEVETFFEQEIPEFVFLAAAKVGGIHANNTYKADFIYENLVIATNVIHCAWKYNITKLINLGSSCIYPKYAEQPIKEESLLTDTLEPSNEPYAIAKIASLKLCRYYNEQYNTNFINVMPPNLYGPGDNFHLQNAHVLPALIRKFHEARENADHCVVLWGDGSPLREFLYVDDLATAMVFIMNNLSTTDVREHINVGYGSDISIQDLASMIQGIVQYQGTVSWDTSKHNGTPRKIMDSTRIHKLGWYAQTPLTTGIQKTYAWFLEHYTTMRK